MKRSITAAAVLVAALLLAGCTGPDAGGDSSPTPSVEAIAPSEIVTIDDGITWARSLDDTATASDLIDGIEKIGNLVPDLDIWFATNNEIGQDLIALNADILSDPDPDSVGTQVDDLQGIVDDIEAAIDHGPRP